LPGLTGLARVRGRGRLSFSEMVALDLEYVRRRSLLLDLQIMISTITVLCRGA
jgi:lipopolysaccharide/colanic/teichoic acid biosynthesis glycosyltransferase